MKLHPATGRLAWRATSMTAILAATASVAVAQGPVSTGTNVSAGRDQSWEVSYTNSAVPGGSGFFNAYVVSSPPGPWQPNTSSYNWISVSSSASIGNNPVSYTYRTTFDLTGYDASTASLAFRCAVDNDFISYSLNGGPPVTTGCPTGSSFQFGSTQTLSSGFVSGANTLSFFTTGDGTTDALLVSIDGFSARQGSTVPEPSSIALVGTGLVGLVPMIRRRRR